MGNVTIVQAAIVEAKQQEERERRRQEIRYELENAQNKQTKKCDPILLSECLLCADLELHNCSPGITTFYRSK